MAWAKRSLRGTDVLARVRDDGSLDEGPDGRVDIKYKPEEEAKVYRASVRNLETVADAPGPAPSVKAPAKTAAKATSPSPAKTTGRPSGPRAAPSSARPTVIYTDGACTGNPGPMGIGAVILRGSDRRELTAFIGVGTNNIAELTAIERALDALDDADRDGPVLVHADSAYAIGVLSGAYKAKKNIDLIARIRAKVDRFPHLKFVKVAGHAGVAENERCDQLATQAIARTPLRR